MRSGYVVGSGCYRRTNSAALATTRLAGAGEDRRENEGPQREGDAADGAARRRLRRLRRRAAGEADAAREREEGEDRGREGGRGDEGTQGEGDAAEGAARRGDEDRGLGRRLAPPGPGEESGGEDAEGGGRQGQHGGGDAAGGGAEYVVDT